MAVETVEQPTTKPAFQGLTSSKVNIIRNGETIVDQSTDEPDASGAETPPAEPKTGEKPVDTTGAAATPPVEGAPENTNPEGATDPETPPAEPGEYTEEDFHEDVNQYLQNSTNGAVKNPQDIANLLAENKKLKADLAHKEPDFPNEKAKKVYELAVAASGLELEKARQLFHVMSLDLSTMTPKEKQFEAFHLERPKLSREEAYKRFEAIYQQSYDDLENNIVQTDKHELATQEAEKKLGETLKGVQETVKQGSKPESNGQPTPEQVAEVEQQLTSALSNFGGVALNFDDSRYGKLQIPMDQGKAQQFMEILKNPQLLVDEIADRARDNSGKLDINAFIREMFLVFERDTIDQKQREHLMKLGKIEEIRDRKNAPKKDLTEQQSTPVKKTFTQSFAEAVSKAGLGN